MGQAIRFLHRTQHQGARDHVMQSLLALREADHEESDAQDHSRKIFREVPTGGPAEGDPVAVLICNF